MSFLLIIGFATHLNGQLLKKLGKRAERAAQRTIERRVDREASKKTDEVLDSILEPGKKRETGSHGGPEPNRGPTGQHRQ